MPKMKREKREAKGWKLPPREEYQRRFEDPNDLTIVGHGHFMGKVARMRPSFELEAYEDDDGRLDPAECEHTQFLDIGFPPTNVWCLDCGAKVVAGEWVLSLPNEVLTDAQLQEKRDQFHGVWEMKKS
jgi:hypothetical protein